MEHQTPIQALKKWQQKKPELFVKRVYNQAGLDIISASLVGYVTCATKMRNWFSILVLATTMSLTFYVILDLEFPRLGAIRIDAADQVLVELRKSMR